MTDRNPFDTLREDPFEAEGEGPAGGGRGSMTEHTHPTNHVFQEDDDEEKDLAVCALCSYPRDDHAKPRSNGALTTAGQDVALVVKARGTKYSLYVEVGPTDAGQFKFGMTAEVFAENERFGVANPPAEVNFAAIGSHSPATARERGAAYMLAATIADMVDRYIAKGIGFETLADSLNNDTILALMLEEQRSTR